MAVINLGISGAPRQHQGDPTGIDQAAWALHDLLCRSEGLLAAVGELLECRSDDEQRPDRGSQAVVAEVRRLMREARTRLDELMAATGSEQRPDLAEFED
ncbi:MAG: hypothetical protein U1E17_25170 [Geminicoccaceae bacterium]